MRKGQSRLLDEEVSRPSARQPHVRGDVHQAHGRIEPLSRPGRHPSHARFGPFIPFAAGRELREEEAVTETLLTPGDRVELAVGPFEDEGAEIAIQSLPYRRTAMRRPRQDVWGTLRVGPRAPSVAAIPAVLARIEPLVPAGLVAPTRTVRLGARMTLHGHDWLINDEQHHHDAPVKVGELQVWELVNETGWITRFTCTGSSSKSSRSTARRPSLPRGRTR